MLMKQVIAHNSAALETLYRKYNHKIFAAVLSIVRNEEDAREITQDVFIQVWQKAAQFSDTKGTFAQWIYVVARNKAYNHLRFFATRAKDREDYYSDEEFETLYGDDTISSRTPLDVMIEGETAAQVHQLIEKLPAVQRLVIIASYLKGYSQHEISDHYNIPIGTVKTWARKGMSILRTLSHAEDKPAIRVPKAMAAASLRIPLSHN